MTAIIVIAILVVLVLVYIGMYNGLQKAKINTEESWSQIDVQLKRRNDLIPNLVETVKGYAKHEQETLSQVVEARNQMVNVPDNVDANQLMQMSDQLSGSLKSLFAVAESYPDLKANQNFLNLQEELTTTENKIAYARQLFNSSAAVYNQKLVTFPSNMVAKMHKFTKVNYLETPQEEKVAPKVQF